MSSFTAPAAMLCRRQVRAERGAAGGAGGSRCGCRGAGSPAAAAPGCCTGWRGGAAGGRRRACTTAAAAAPTGTLTTAAAAGLCDQPARCPRRRAPAATTRGRHGAAERSRLAGVGHAGGKQGGSGSWAGGGWCGAVGLARRNGLGPGRRRRYTPLTGHTTWLYAWHAFGLQPSNSDAARAWVFCPQATCVLCKLSALSYTSERGCTRECVPRTCM